MAATASAEWTMAARAVLAYARAAAVLVLNGGFVRNHLPDLP
jgi:hypothetical protein